MIYRVVTFIWGFVLDLVALSGLMDDEKDLQILLLRQQLRIVERKKTTRLIIPRWQKVPLAVLAVRLKEKTNHTRKSLEKSVRLFKPDTLLRWHRDLVRRKWTFKGKGKPGRPAIDPELEKWILQVAKDNPGLGFEKLEGEMRKLGLEVSFVTIRTVLRRNGIPPAPDRSRSSWRRFLNHYKDQFLACGECLRLILLAKSVEYTGGKTEEVSDAQADRKPTDTGKDARSGVGRIPERRAGDDYAGRIGFHF